MASRERRFQKAFLPFVLIVQTLLVVVHAAVAESLVAAFGIGGVSLVQIFIILSFTFIASSYLEHKYRGRLVRLFYVFSAYWLGLVFFLFGGAFSFLVSEYFLYKAGIFVQSSVLGAIFFGLFFLIHAYGTWMSWRTRTVGLNVEIPGLHPDWRGKKIVFVSDLHFGNVRGEGFAAKIGKMIEELRPEAILIGGDMYDGSVCDEAGMIEPLRGAVEAAPKGAYFVSGNHEYALSDPEAAFAAVRSLGIRVLDGEKVCLGGLCVAGVDYEKARKREDFKNALSSISGSAGSSSGDADSPTIFMKHEPKDLDLAGGAGMALGLFGHTHNGQIWPLSYIPRRVYKRFDYGRNAIMEMLTYTSSGAGTWGPPLRIGTRSEIVCITIA